MTWRLQETQYVDLAPLHKTPCVASVSNTHVFVSTWDALCSTYQQQAWLDAFAWHVLCTTCWQHASPNTSTRDIVHSTYWDGSNSIWGVEGCPITLHGTRKGRNILPSISATWSWMQSPSQGSTATSSTWPWWPAPLGTKVDAPILTIKCRNRIGKILVMPHQPYAPTIWWACRGNAGTGDAVMSKDSGSSEGRICAGGGFPGRHMTVFSSLKAVYDDW
jgi:hypothetical protein